MVSIQIDRREPLEEITPIMDKILAAIPDLKIDVKYESMDYGDYLITNGHNLLIERKQIADFVNSYKGHTNTKGDLKAKLFTMRQQADSTALLIEGHYITKKGNGYLFLDRGNGPEPVMKLKTYFRFLTSQMEKGTWVYYTNSLFETVLTVVYLAEYLPSLYAPNPSLKCGNVRELFAQVPGIGPTLLAKLQREYPDPKSALEHMDEWANRTILRSFEKW